MIGNPSEPSTLKLNKLYMTSCQHVHLEVLAFNHVQDDDKQAVTMTRLMIMVLVLA
jgi:hypothetical protein